MHVVLVGLMGAGKTPTGSRVADRLGWPFVDGDDELEARAGRTAKALASERGLAALHDVEAQVLLDLLRHPAPSVISAAASVVEDERCRSALRQDAFVAWLRADPSALADRATDRGNRPLDGDVAEQLREQAAARAPWFHDVADVVVDVDELDPDAAANHILGALPTG